jgi:hypothetical protein
MPSRSSGGVGLAQRMCSLYEVVNSRSVDTDAMHMRKELFFQLDVSVAQNPAVEA